MKNDILITGGHIIDPACNINAMINKLRIINDIIVDADKYPVTSETRIIHADGMIVTPGLIDYHAHVFMTLYRKAASGLIYKTCAAEWRQHRRDAGSAGTDKLYAFTNGDLRSSSNQRF